MADNDEVTILEIGVEGRPGRLESEDRQRVDRAIAYGEAASGAVSQAAEAARLAAADVATVAGLTARSVVRADRSEIAMAAKAPGRAWQVSAAVFVAALGSTAIPDLPDVEPAPWAAVTLAHFRTPSDGSDWQPAFMRAQEWSAAHGVPVIEPVAVVVDIMQPIQPVSGATVVLPRDFTIRRRFQGGGVGTFMIDDKAIGVTNWNWTGGKLDGAGPAGFNGGGVRFTGTNCNIDWLEVFDYQNGGSDGSGASMAFLYGGNNVWLRNCKATVSVVGRDHLGTGAFRLTGGTDSGTIDCIGESGDDCFQFVTSTAPGGVGFDQSHVRCMHIRPRGKSWKARAVLAGIGGVQDAQMTCSIIDCLVIDGHFTGMDGRMVNIKNNRSTGLIHNFRLVRCIFDRSGDMSGSTQGSISITVDPTNGRKVTDAPLALGGIGDIYLTDCQHIGGPTGPCFDIDSGRAAVDGTWLEPTSRARIFLEGGVWSGAQFAQIDGKLEFFVTKPTRAVSYGTASHVVMVGARYAADFLDLRKLDIIGVPSNFAGVRINAGGTLYAPEKISKAAGATLTTGMSRSDTGVVHVYLPPVIDYATDKVTMGVMETDPATAAVLAQMPTRGITMFDNNAIASLSWGTHGPAVIDTTLLTSNRIRNLMTNSTQKPGDIFEITRTGGDTGGPWNLTIRSAPSTILTDLKTGQWGRFVWTGTAWALLARGSLA